MIPSGHNHSRLDLAALERRELLLGAPKKPSPLRTEITEEYLQEVEQRSKVALQQTRELLDATDASSERLRQSLGEAWNSIESLENTIRLAEQNLNRPGRIQRLREWTHVAKNAVADRVKTGSYYVRSMSPRSRVVLIALALMAILASIWQVIVQARYYRPFSLVLPS